VEAILEGRDLFQEEEERFLKELEEERKRTSTLPESKLILDI